MYVFIELPSKAIVGGKHSAGTLREHIGVSTDPLPQSRVGPCSFHLATATAHDGLTRLEDQEQHSFGQIEIVPRLDQVG